MSLAISSEWAEFLDRLHRKPDGEPLCFYQRDLDFLYVICGNGPCSDWNRLSIGTMIFEGVDIIEKMYPEDFGLNGDNFAGLEIWGGVQDFLSHHYKFALGEKYDEFRIHHNMGMWSTQIAEVVNFLVEDKRGLAKAAWPLWQERVSRALIEHAPAVHIPLLQL